MKPVSLPAATPPPNIGGYGWDLGARSALLHAAEYARRGGKVRSAEWLQVCAGLVTGRGLGIDEWPDAPAYKGLVVHVDDPEPDASKLTNEQLTSIYLAVANESARRTRETKNTWGAVAGERRGVLGADGERIGEVWPDGDEWHCRYTKLSVSGFDKNPPSFDTRDAAIAWVLQQDVPRIKAQHEANADG